MNSVHTAAAAAFRTKDLTLASFPLALSSCGLGIADDKKSDAHIEHFSVVSIEMNWRKESFRKEAFFIIIAHNNGHFAKLIYRISISNCGNERRGSSRPLPNAWPLSSLLFRILHGVWAWGISFLLLFIVSDASFHFISFVFILW